VTGVDVSAAMLGKARAAGSANITYIHADVTGELAWWDGRAFDGCTCEMALMDIDDLAGALSAVTAVRPDGWFVASMVHPCFPEVRGGRAVGRQGGVMSTRGSGSRRKITARGRSDPGGRDAPQVVHLPERAAGRRAGSRMFR
jgi:hypothetical protein